MIQIEQLTKTYGSETVLNIDELLIPQGQCFGLVGNNGAGKTTLFRLMLDLIAPTSGRVLINGRDVRENDDWKRYTGSYLDEHFLLGFLTPDEYFDYLAGLYSLSPEDLQQHLARFQALFNEEITGKKKYIRDLSKGNIKKTGIASAMMGHPDVVLLDEPFENLDPTSQIRLKALIQQEIAERNVTFLVSSHDLNHITDMCNRVVILEKGLIVRDVSGDRQQIESVKEYFLG